MAELRSSSTWGSVLTAEEFAAIRSVGFEPVGQVFGAAVYSAGSVGGYSCPGAPGPSGGGLPPRSSTQVSGRGGAGSFGPLVQTMDQARRTAVGRMTTECAELGGHGVLGVRQLAEPLRSLLLAVRAVRGRVRWRRSGPRGQGAYGMMFWLMWKRLPGS